MLSSRTGRAERWGLHWWNFCYRLWRNMWWSDRWRLMSVNNFFDAGSDWGGLFLRGTGALALYYVGGNRRLKLLNAEFSWRLLCTLSRHSW